MLLADRSFRMGRHRFNFLGPAYVFQNSEAVEGESVNLPRWLDRLNQFYGQQNLGMSNIRYLSDTLLAPGGARQTLKNLVACGCVHCNFGFTVNLHSVLSCATGAASAACLMRFNDCLTAMKA